MDASAILTIFGIVAVVTPILGSPVLPLAPVDASITKPPQLVGRVCGGTPDTKAPGLSISPRHFEYIIAYAGYDPADGDLLNHGVEFTVDRQDTASDGIITKCRTPTDDSRVRVQEGACFDSPDGVNWSPSGIFTYKHDTRELKITLSWQCEDDEETALSVTGNAILSSTCCSWWADGSKCTLTEGITFPTTVNKGPLSRRLPLDLPPSVSGVLQRALSEKRPSCAEASVGPLEFTIPPGFWYHEDDIGRRETEFNVYNPASRTCVYCTPTQHTRNFKSECFEYTADGTDVVIRGNSSFNYDTRKLQVTLAWTCDGGGENGNDSEVYTATGEGVMPWPMTCTNYQYTRRPYDLPEETSFWPDRPIKPEPGLQKRRGDLWCNTTSPAVLPAKLEA